MSVKLKVEERHVSTESNYQLRKSGVIPAVYYYKDEDSSPLKVSNVDMLKALKSHEPVIELSNGKLAVVKEVQRDPVSHKLLHVSFEGVVKGQKFVSEVNLEVVHEEKAPWKNNGYVVRQLVQTLEVECTPSNLPEKLTLDVSQCSEDDVLTVRDLVLPEGVSVKEDSEMNLVVFSHEKQLDLEEESESTESEEEAVDSSEVEEKTETE